MIRKQTLRDPDHSIKTFFKANSRMFPVENTTTIHLSLNPDDEYWKVFSDAPFTGFHDGESFKIYS